MRLAICRTCDAFDVTAVSTENEDEAHGGFCRRHAPLHLGEEVGLDRPDHVGDKFKRSVWPSVRATDWCLEHTFPAGRTRKDALAEKS